MNDEHERDLILLLEGQPPESSATLQKLTVGFDKLTNFWQSRYLDDYISQGGGRFQCLTGKRGSGKTHLLKLFLSQAEGFKTIYFSARKIWLHDFKDIFFAIILQCDIQNCLKDCAAEIIRRMGFVPEDIPPQMSFIDYLSEIGENNPPNKREIRNQLNEMFFRNSHLDNNFAMASAWLTGGILGYPTLEEPSKAALISWLHGDKDLKLASIRRLGLSPSRITKYNARHMLRSLGEIIRMAGYKGLLIAIDDVEMLVTNDSLETIRYTKARRNDAYESLRELLDEIDSMHNMWFFLAFDRSLIDDENIGLKSYYALWMRLQNEVSSERPNYFSNMMDLDKLPNLDVSEVVEMSQKLCALLEAEGLPARPLDESAAEELLARAVYGNIALPLRVIWEVCGKEASS